MEVPVRVEHDGPVTTVILHRPHARNAVDGPTALALADAFRAFDADENASVAVLYGEGGTFCAGADLKAVGTERGNQVQETGDGPMGPTRLRLGKPVIAAIEGYAVAGGLELALWCDLRIASPTATFGCAERRWGVPLIDGGTQRLPRVVGTGRALDLILTGRTIDADEALTIGLVTQLADDPIAGALELAAEIAAFPQETVRSDRRAVLEGQGLDLREGLALEAALGRDRLGAAFSGARRFAGRMRNS